MLSLLARPQMLAAGIASGIVGAITLDAYRLLVHWPGVPYLNFAQRYSFDASIAVSTAAEGASWAVPFGIVLHLAVSIFWAFGYLWVAQQQPQLVRRPVISGLAFGLVVWLVML